MGLQPLQSNPREVFQRTRGALRLGFAVRAGKTAAVETFQSGASRVRFPHTSGALETIVLNTAGGLTGGDALTLSLTAAADTEVVITGQACEKIYKASSGTAVIRTDLTLRSNASLDYIPQPTIVFNQAQLDREISVQLGAESRLLALEAAILGRTAMDEEFREGSLRDVWKVWRDGRLVFADALVLAGEDTVALASPWALGNARAYATLIYAAPDAESRRDELRVIIGDDSGAASAWNGLLVARLVAPDGYTLMRSISRILSSFRDRPLPRMWSF